MITATGSVFHTHPGVFIPEEPRKLLKLAGFVFHWGMNAVGPRGGHKCPQGCPGCEAKLPDKVWATATHTGLDGMEELFDDRARKAFEQAIHNGELSRAAESDIKVPCPNGLSYLPYQLAAIRYAMCKNRVLFGDQMGLGKTIEALGWINACGKDVRTVLIICPATLKLNWARECKKWLVLPRTIHIIDSPDLPPNEADIVIVNYERIIGKRNEALLNNLMSAAVWDMLIVDEAHRIKTRGAQRSVAILGRDESKKLSATPGLIDVADRIAMLTGTPIPNRPKELFPLLNVLDPAGFGNEWKFLQRYCGAEKKSFWKKGPDGPQEHVAWRFEGSSNLKELQERMRSTVMVRRLKADVLPELPDKIRQIIPVTAGKHNSKLIEKMAETWDKEPLLVRLRAAAALAEATSKTMAYEKALDRLHAAEVRFAFEVMAVERRDLGIAKLPMAVEHIMSILDGGCDKLVVFAHHHEVIESLEKTFGTSCVVLYGPMSEAKRQASVDRFQNDPSIPLFIGSIQAAGVGLTLTAAARMLFIETSWNPADISQCEDRIHRYGQKFSVLIEHLIIDGSIEATMLMRVLAKQQVIDRALDVRMPTPDPHVLEPVLPTPRPSPVASEAQRRAAAECLQRLHEKCDGARTQDGVGFDAAHQAIGKRLARLASKRALTDAEVALAGRFLPRYHQQLPLDLLRALRGGSDQGNGNDS